MKTNARVWMMFLSGVLFTGLAGLGGGVAPAEAEESAVRADFNGDGRTDLAIGVPFEDVSSTRLTNAPVMDAGAVNVAYGSAAGLVMRLGNGLQPQIWHQEKLGNVLEAGDRFGSSLSASNFGRNRFIFARPPRVIATADLAIGVPSEDVFLPGSTDPSLEVKGGGAVNVIYGSTGGLSVAGFPGPGASQIWIQGYDGVPGSPGVSDELGAAVY